MLALTVNLAGNGRTSLWDRDEPRYAGCTREMAARGDWLHPTFNGEPRNARADPDLLADARRLLGGGGQPVRGSTGLLDRWGGDVFACARAWAANAGRAGRADRGADVGVLADHGDRVEAGHDRRHAGVLPGGGAGVSLGAFAKRLFSRRVALGFWALLALAMLTKGPVGLALIACAGVASWLFHGPMVVLRRLEWKWGQRLLSHSHRGIPWYVAIGIATGGDFWSIRGRQPDRRARITSGPCGRSRAGFPATILGRHVRSDLLHPWSALVPAAIVAAWGAAEGGPRL